MALISGGSTTGYVTEPLVGYHFTITVTSDSVEHLSLSDIQISKEVRIYISPDRYPTDFHSEFEKITKEDYRRGSINKCLSLSKALEIGDQIECSVFIVEPETRSGVTTYAINNRRTDIETYADFDHLWLYPNNRYFRRSEADSQESLKFRKKWRYTCINRERYEKITGYTLFGYRRKKWVNKNPKMTFPIIWCIQVKTTASNLWKRITGPENPPKTTTHKLAIIGILVGIMGFVATIVFGIISIVFGRLF
ncbi:MAG: hypothetical protein OXN25_01635 [Candidatus Poribacteria bacterium]|nr:hypothetical protein [Candidatus Poribacteria bacterium]